MTFTAILILNLLLDVAIVAALAFVMSRARSLTPHRTAATPIAAHAASAARRSRRPLAPLRPVLG